MTARATSGYFATKRATDELPIECPMRIGRTSFSSLIRPARVLDLHVWRIGRRRRIGEAVAPRVEHDDVVLVLELPGEVRPAK